MKWWFVVDPKGDLRGHAFPEVIKSAILSQLEELGMRFPEQGQMGALREITDFTLDWGGPCRQNEPCMDYQLDGLKISIPVTQVDMYLRGLSNPKMRDDIGQPYCKIYEAYRCVCVLPDQLRSLVAQIKATLTEAEALAEVENQYFNRMLDRAEAAGVPIAMRRRPTKEPVEA